MNYLKTIALGVTLGLAMTSCAAFAKQPPAVKTDTKTAKPPAPTLPTAQEIADAHTKGLVWVNLKSGVYHKDGEFYGKTKSGKFMTEDEAKKSGYHLAQEPGAKKHTASASKKTTK